MRSTASPIRNFERYDVIVVGGGISGLAAAHRLSQAGQRVLLLEGGGRLGGRIHSKVCSNSGGISELGAEFIHGLPPELWKLVREAGMQTREHTDVMPIIPDFPFPMPGQDDLSIADFLARSDLSPAQCQHVSTYVEDFHAANINEASLLAFAKQQAAERELSSIRVWKIVGGYGDIVTYLTESILASGVKLLLNAKVTSITWSTGSVTVCAGKQEFCCAQVVVALPLGVLQSRSVHFDPPPYPILQAADSMKMGSACRFVLRFRKLIWQPEIAFFAACDDSECTWWALESAGLPNITGWIAGPKAKEFASLPDEERRQRVLRSAALSLRLESSVVEGALVEYLEHDWQNDPLFCGAYSWVPVGAEAASKEMTIPVAGTLYFAGEHTDTTCQWGTVHGALLSGYRAADQIRTSEARGAKSTFSEQSEKD